MTETKGGEKQMKKVIVLTMTIIFLWTGLSFAENWIMYYEGSSLQSYFDADRVVKSGNGFDYWSRDTFTPEFLGNKYLLQHYQIELRNGDWWIQKMESWYIDAQGKAGDHYPADSWKRMSWSNKSYGIALLDDLRKYGR
jgi:hypothetical protein